jgi:hypothetical protein
VRVYQYSGGSALWNGSLRTVDQQPDRHVRAATPTRTASNETAHPSTKFMWRDATRESANHNELVQERANAPLHPFAEEAPFGAAEHDGGSRVLLKKPEKNEKCLRNL